MSCSRYPQHIDNDNWYYEESTSLHLYQRGGDKTIISWRKLLASLKRNKKQAARFMKMMEVRSK